MEQGPDICRAEPQGLQGEEGICARGGKTVLNITAQLTPFVSRQVKAEPGDYQGLNKGPQDPFFYVEQWKRYNGVD